LTAAMLARCASTWRVFLGEQIGVLAAVHVDQADHLPVVPQGNAHGRADFLQHHALAFAEALVRARQW
jgi:hypothetical protein